VIPNFVDTRRFNPAIPPVGIEPSLAAWIAGRPVILCPRRLVPKNGVDVAIRAMRVLADRKVACALIVTGDGPRRASLEALVDELKLGDCVRLLGDTPAERMPGWARRAAVVVVPSVPSKGVEEATSISVLEAQACGCAVVASALGGILEIVADGTTGALFPPGDAVALGDAIARTLADPNGSAALGARAAQSVAEHHSHVAGARAYEVVYRSLIAN
jgi:glycosyltransferase involved in cell wall biosynthesis